MNLEPPPATVLTDSIVQRLLSQASTGRLAMHAGGRRWFRDEKCRQLQLRVSPTAGAFVRVFWEAGKRRRHVLGDADAMTVAEARAECDRRRLGDRSHSSRRAAAGEMTADEAFAAMQAAAAKGTWKAGRTSPKPQTQKTERELWKPNVTEPGHGRHRLTAFAAVAPKVFEHLSADRKPTANRFLKTCKAIYAYARQRHGYRGPHPDVDAVTGERRMKPHQEKKRKRFLTPTQVKLMADHMESQPHPWRTYWLLAVLVGPRMGNLISARWSDVDLEAGLWTFPETKSGEPATVAVQPEAVGLLRDLRKTTGASPFLFPSPADPGNHRSQWRDSWDRCRLAVPELADTRPHDCRRTCGSLLTIAGVPLPVVGQQLGHAPGSQATAIYARLDIEAQKQAAAKLGRVLRGVVKPGGDDGKK